VAFFDAAFTDAAFVLPQALTTPQDVTTLRWATAGYRSAPDDTPPNTLWGARLLGDLVIRQGGIDAISLGGMLGIGLGEIGVSDADAALADLDRWGTADGREIRVTVIPVVEPMRSDYGTPLAGRGLGASFDFSSGLAMTRRTDPTLAFRGLIQRIDRNADRTGVIRISDWAERLNVPLQPVKFLGTGGLEGGDDLEGKPKPVAVGHAGNITPVDLGDVDIGAGIGPLRTYMVNWREVAGVPAVRVRGLAQTLVTGNPVLGQARVFPELGMFQLGGTPDGAVTADVRGDAAGGYPSSLAGVIQRVVSAMGPQLGPSEIDATAFAFAEMDLPGEVGWYQGPDDTTCAAFITGLVQSCGALLVARRGGRLGLVDPLATGDAQFTLTPSMIIECEPVPMPLSLRPLPREVAVNWRRNWTPLTDMAGLVPSADRSWLSSMHSGPARAASTKITRMVAQQQQWTFDGAYWAEADARARAQKCRAWLEGGPRAFRITTDRYLDQIECGHLGHVTYPAHELDAGAPITVVDYEERVAERRLTMIVITRPEV